VLPEGDTLSIRLLDAERRELYYHATLGEAWDSPAGREAMGRRFLVDLSPPESGGAYVFQTGEPYQMDDVSKAPHYIPTFRDTRREIVAPISVGSVVFGTIEVRIRTQRAFSRHARAITRLIGQHLGLYHFLVTTLLGLRSARAELLQQRTDQAKVFEDLEHQLKTPIVSAHAWIQAALSPRNKPEQLQGQMLAIRGVTKKARRVALNMRHFSALAQGKPLNAKLAQLDHQWLLRMLGESAADSEILLPRHRRISFELDRASFQALHGTPAYVDRDLLEQAVSNLLDNAGKYSYSDRAVVISGGRQGTDRFFISIVNFGLPIRAWEIQHVVERGYRGEAAKLTTGEGAGIGLWLTEHIMRAHGGELVIIPTGREDRTEIRLVFPSARTR